MQIIIAILVFGFLIFFHELGHFLTAKKAGMLVHDFSIGMGPALLQKQVGETKYALRLLPIGGYVNVEGESGDSDDPRAFPNIPLPKRILFVMAGSLMNLLLGLIVLLILTGQMEKLPTTTIAGFKDNAVSSGKLQARDEILKVNGRTMHIVDDISFEMLSDKDGIVDFTVRREGAVYDIPAVDFEMTMAENGQRYINFDFYVASVENSFPKGLAYSFQWGISIARQVWLSFINLVTGKFAMSEISGPVGVSTAIGKASAMGLAELLHIVAFITINLGVFNLLPIPALDGGRLVFLLIEAVIRRPVNPKYESYIHAGGLILLLGFVAVVTVNDILKFF